MEGRWYCSGQSIKQRKEELTLWGVCGSAQANLSGKGKKNKPYGEKLVLAWPIYQDKAS